MYNRQESKIKTLKEKFKLALMQNFFYLCKKRYYKQIQRTSNKLGNTFINIFGRQKSSVYNI